MANEEDDIIIDIIARVRLAVPGFSDEQALALEKQIRHDWGGERPYIAKDHRRRPHERKRLREKLKTSSVVDLAKTEPVSRRTLYRLLSSSESDD